MQLCEMGCINSTKKLTELKHENVFRVRVVRLQPESPAIRSGFLELTQRELIFTTQGREPVVWALQHLRRYGLNADIFSFEAGRRCMTGPGIYTFRCQQAEQLYQLFQRYVNAVSMVTDESFTFPERDRDHPSHTLGRPDPNPHTNNYLEPAPVTSATIRAVVAHESFSSSPHSLDLDSPDSVPSLSFTNEVVHFQNQQPQTPGVYANANSNTNTNSSANVYLDHPLRSGGYIEHNNNNNNNNNIPSVVPMSQNVCGVSSASGGSGSAFSTLKRKSIAKRFSLDVPPEECAPMLLTPGAAFDALHMYANVEGLGGTGQISNNSAREREKVAAELSERCYENLSRLDLPLLLQSPLEKTPASTTDTAFEMITGGVNYIVLDLDQPRSPVQSSPKTCFGSGLSLTIATIDGSSAADATATQATQAERSALDAASNATPIATGNTTNKLDEHKEQKQKHQQLQLQYKTESSLGYSTIDFIKTCALIKSSTHGADFDADTDHDNEHEESRRTRHSKGVRKAYSISE